jgi:hypothetical protein
LTRSCKISRHDGFLEGRFMSSSVVETLAI